MMELMTGYPPDIFAAIWHDPAFPEDKRADLPSHKRDAMAGPHDVRVLAKYARGATPVTKTELIEQSVMGMGSWRDFGRVAVITDERWMRQAVQFFAPFFHGPVRVFSNAQANDARIWVNSHDHH